MHFPPLKMNQHSRIIPTTEYSMIYNFNAKKSIVL